MSAEAFFDTNVLIYALAQDDPRTAAAEQLLRDGGVVSVQVLNEFVSVARRKLGLAWPEVVEALAAVSTLCGPPSPLTADVHDAAVDLARAHDLNIYDALILASALGQDCTVLYSEDLQDGRRFDRRLTVRNPFAG
jgi:predicted nucleic acid-binding protein